MATSNIQETGLENSIFFIEPDLESQYEDYKHDEVFEGCTKDEVMETLNENFWDYINNGLIDNMELVEIDVNVFNHYEQTEYCDVKWDWLNINLKTEVKWCYYDWANLIITCSEDLENLELSNAWQKTIDIAIRKLEKEMRKHSTELWITGRFSNWETIYHKK